jgi:RND superfamily putative drug exporter
MLARIGSFVVRRRRPVLVAALLAFLVAGAVGGGAAKHLSSGGFDNPAAEATKASNALKDQFHQGSPNLVVVVTAKTGTVDSPSVVAVGNQLSQQLAATTDVRDVASYWSLGSVAPLRSKNNRSALIIARIAGAQNEVVDRAGEIQTDLEGHPPAGVTVRVGGFGPTFHEVNHTVEKDLQKAEMVAIPITIVLLLLVFGSGMASLMPLVTGALSVIGTFLILRVLAGFTEVSIFSLNMTTSMGFGLGIDYSLFIVTRFREELAAGHAPNDAVIRTVCTAGRTVAFSALTVAASLSALLVFPLAFLRSFAYAGVAVAALAGVCAVVVLPALLAALGARVNALPLWKRSLKPAGEGFWHRVATVVMRRPIPFVTAALVLLVALGAPFLGLKLGYPDDRVLPPSSHVRQVNDMMREQFSSKDFGATSVVLPDLTKLGNAAARAQGVDRYATEISKVSGVGRVDAPTGIYFDGDKLPAPAAVTQRFEDPTGAGTWLSVVPTLEPLSTRAVTMVQDIRDVPTPDGVRALVGGQSAEMADTNASVFGRLPLALGIIAVVTFVLLFWAFGSVLVPLKALVMNVLSLSATFGAMVWIFQEGHWSGFLNFTPTGTLAATMPILMFCVAFGLSMDYEVFLLSRIKEEHDRGQPNEQAIAHGLERTGRIVTAAALLMSIVFLAMATGQVSFIKLFGIGLTLAVLMDAFVIRGTLVPALMRLAGNANWWAPGPLRRLHDRYGFSEHIDLDAGAHSETGRPSGGAPADGLASPTPIATARETTHSDDDKVGSSMPR